MRPLRRVLIQLPLCVIVGLSAMVSLGTTIAASEPQPSDALIEGTIEDVMAADPGVPPAQIDVAVNDGIAVLRGAVDNLLAKERARRLTTTVVGVRSVVDLIEIIPPPGQTEEGIETAIETSLAADPVAQTELIRAEFEDGTAYLFGSVDSYQERELIGWVARGVPGVFAVDNRLDVSPQAFHYDTETQNQILKAVRWNPYLNARQLQVRVRDGRAILSGTVGSPGEKRLATNLAWLAGVASVDASAVSVEHWAYEPMRRRAEQVVLNDVDLRSAIRDALRFDPRVDAGTVHVGVVNGMVTLRGRVQTAAARQAAVQDTRNTPGVFRVRDRILTPP